jgi:hypothetical protein
VWWFAIVTKFWPPSAGHARRSAVDIVRTIAGSTPLSDGAVVVDQVGPDARNNVE